LIRTENSILIHAPVDRIFEAAADLSGWPKILPHYRWIKYLEKSATENTVVMAAWRILPRVGGIRIPVRWTSKQSVDREKNEIRFHHLNSWTKGMDVVWSFSQMPDGVRVRIRHDFASQIPILGILVEPIVGNFFVHFIADETLHHMKIFAENERGT
jgi:ribosome-associated toxin RatA of RatAB toxin-antitoxin module